MIDEDYLKQIKKNAYIINTSRGKIFKEATYFSACKHKCVMDVFPQEYGPKLREYIQSAYISTPHIAGYNYRSRIEGSLQVALSFLKYLEIKESRITNIMQSIKEKLALSFVQIRKENFHLLNSIQQDNSILKIEEIDAAKFFLNRRKNYPPRLGLREIAKFYKEGKLKLEKLCPYSQKLIKLYSKEENTTLYF